MSNYTKSTNFATKDNLSPGDPLKIVRGTEIDTEFNNIATAIATKTDNSAAAITGGSITGITDLAIADGGTGASTATAAINNLLPSQTSNANKYLQTDGTNVSWDAVSLSTSDITGTLPVANGGTGVTSSTGTGSVVLSNSPTLVTPALGTPASGVATNLTGLPISTGVSGLGTGVATFLGTPSSANLASAVSDETGSGALVFANSPTLVTPALGTPSSATLTNATGLPISTGVSGLGTGVATFLATPSSANLRSALTDETGSGSAVFATSPALVTPDLGTPSAATLTNATGLPISTGVSGLGTGVATALAVNVGSAGAPVINGGALGTPSSGTVTNLTGTASININGTVGATTPTTGAFTTVAASSSVTLSGGTANGVTYLNGSKVLTSGSALTFDGTNLGVGTTSPASRLHLAAAGTVLSQFSDTTNSVTAYLGILSSVQWIGTTTNHPISFNINSSEQMRLTSTGLGIGTSSPSQKLTVSGGIASVAGISALTASSVFFDLNSGIGRFAAVGSTTGTPASITLSQYSSNGSVGRDAVTIDSSGNLGLGVTPSAWWSAIKPLQMSGNGFVGSASNYTYLGSNFFYNSSANPIYVASAAASLFEQGAGAFKWYTAASGTAGNAITFTQAMTLDASGNLVVGHTSASYKLDVWGTTSIVGHIRNNTVGTGALAQLQFSTSNNYDGFSKAAVGAICENANTRATALGFYSEGSDGTLGERARIDSSGNLLVGTTSIEGAGGLTIKPNNSDGAPSLVFNRASTTATSYVVDFRNAGTTVGYISHTNTATSYVTSSDYRLKNTIAPMTGALAKVALLKPCTYKWNVDGSDGQGFIAHELAEVVPQCVTGEKDAVDADGNPKYQGIDTSFLVATLTAAIQELKAEFDAYKASHP